jgi:hypothetical protein
MEADWEFVVGGDAPVIDACWPGFVDLRHAPERAWELAEAAQLAALAATLAKLNAPASPVWTAKCDYWPRLEVGEFDPDELDAPTGCADVALGCYIDLLLSGGQQWALPEQAEGWCKRICVLLRAMPLHCCRVDLVIRRAFVTPQLTGLGVTAYLTACGASSAEAESTLDAALARFADALCSHSTIE